MSGARGSTSLLAFLFVTCVGLPQARAIDDDLHITYGPILGRLSSDGIGIWARTSKPAKFGVRYGTSADKLDREAGPVTTKLDADCTGWIYVKGLKSNTKYYYTLTLPENPGATGRSGSFTTMPNRKDFLHPELNPKGLFNYSFEFACGNNQNLNASSGPGLPAFKTMLDKLKDRIHFAILNGDWMYEVQREFNTDQWRRQIGRGNGPLPPLVEHAPTITGVWQNYKHFLTQGTNMARWHREVPTFFTYDDHEILNDVWGAGTPGLRDRRAVFRDIGVRAWYDYLGWANPTKFPQRVHIAKGQMKKGTDILFDRNADFTKMDLAQISNLHVHWGTRTAGVNDNALDGVGGVPNAGVYRIVKVLDKNRLQIEPPAKADGFDSYSIGRRSYFRMRIANCDFFICDTRGQRQMHDTKDPYKKGLSMLGPVQRKWLLDGTRNSDADFIFVVSSVNFMVPHVGGGMVRAVNKDDAWTVFFDEREALIEAWDKLKKPVCVLTGDLHNSFAIKITDNVWEFASGPHNSRNHKASDEGARPANGKFKYGPREVDIRWSTYFRADVPRPQMLKPTFCVVKINNVFNNPDDKGHARWVAYPRPQVIFRYFDGRSGEFLYAESLLATEK
jgi:phosphodiesterase/alkaline phosphatase D-like protein